MNANATESAFPLIFTGDPNAQCYGAGLTKRELFAAMALQGMLAYASGDGRYEVYAKGAVKLADSLIAALNEGGEV